MKTLMDLPNDQVGDCKKITVRSFPFPNCGLIGIPFSYGYVLLSSKRLLKGVIFQIKLYLDGRLRLDLRKTLIGISVLSSPIDICFRPSETHLMKHN